MANVENLLPEKLAHLRATITGAKEGQPKRIGEELEPTDAVKRFGMSIVRPVVIGGVTVGFDHANPDIFPNKSPQEMLDAWANSLQEAYSKTKDPGKQRRLRAILDNLPDVEAYPLSFSQEPSPTLRDELNDPLRIPDPRKNSEGRQQMFTCIFANREAMKAHPDQAVSVYHGLYMNEVGKKDESWARIQEIARLMPNRALLAFDFPGMGGTDPLTKEQISDFGADTFFGIPDAELRILQSLKIKKINVFGISMGGLMSLALAARARAFGIDVEHVIPIDTPGLEDISLLSMALRNKGEMNPRLLNLHHSSPADPVMWKVSGLENPEDLQKPEPPSATWHSDPMLRYARMMMHDTVAARATSILLTQPKARLLFANGSEDGVSRLAVVSKLVKELQGELLSEAERDDLDPQEAKKRVSRVVLPGLGHLAFVHPEILAPMIKSQLDHSFL